MSLRHIWNDEQRSRLLSQLAANSRAFTAALPAEEAIDGLIMNLHLCLTLELSPAEVQAIFSAPVLTFLAGMLAASHSENVEACYALDPDTPLRRRPLVKTEIGQVESGTLCPASAGAAGRASGTVHLVFRGRLGRQAPQG